MSRKEYERDWKRKKRLDPAFRLKAAATQRKYYANDVNKKEKAAVYRLKTRYGLTPEQYQTLFDKQEGRCAICKKHQSELKIRLVIDHDHKSLEIRSLLCAYCNLRVVSKLRRDTIQRIYDYLMGDYTGWFVPPKPKRKRKWKKSRKVA